MFTIEWSPFPLAAHLHGSKLFIRGYLDSTPAVVAAAFCFILASAPWRASKMEVRTLVQSSCPFILIGSTITAALCRCYEYLTPEVMNCFESVPTYKELLDNEKTANIQILVRLVTNPRHCHASQITRKKWPRKEQSQQPRPRQSLSHT